MRVDIYRKFQLHHKNVDRVCHRAFQYRLEKMLPMRPIYTVAQECVDFSLVNLLTAVWY